MYTSGSTPPLVSNFDLYHIHKSKTVSLSSSSKIYIHFLNIFQIKKINSHICTYTIKTYNNRGVCLAVRYMSTCFVTFHSVMHLLWYRKDRAELLMSVLLCTTTGSGHEFSHPFLFSLLFDLSCDCFGFSSAIFFIFKGLGKIGYSKGLWARLLTYLSVFIILLHDMIKSFLGSIFIV